jgi:hypothetical protein
MKTDEQLWKICEDIYIDMFLHSKPKFDFRIALRRAKGGQKLPREWYMKYHLSEPEQTDILRKHCKKHKLTKHEEDMVNFTVLLGCAPTSFRKGKKVCVKRA